MINVVGPAAFVEWRAIVVACGYRHVGAVEVGTLLVAPVGTAMEHVDADRISGVQKGVKVILNARNLVRLARVSLMRSRLAPLVDPSDVIFAIEVGASATRVDIRIAIIETIQPSVRLGKDAWDRASPYCVPTTVVCIQD